MSKQCPKISQNFPKSPKMFKNVLECQKMSQNVQKCPKTSKKIKKYPPNVQTISNQYPPFYLPNFSFVLLKFAELLNCDLKFVVLFYFDTFRVMIS